VKFLVDAQLPPALARALAVAGYDAEHAEDAGLRQAKDRAIWDYALLHGRVIIKRRGFRQPLVGHLPMPANYLGADRQLFATSFAAMAVAADPDIGRALQQGSNLVELR
jgi:hypothetical protein